MAAIPMSLRGAVLLMFFHWVAVKLEEDQR